MIIKIVKSIIQINIDLFLNDFNYLLLKLLPVCNCRSQLSIRQCTCPSNTPCSCSKLESNLFFLYSLYLGLQLQSKLIYTWLNDSLQFWLSYFFLNDVVRIDHILFCVGQEWAKHCITPRKLYKWTKKLVQWVPLL